MECHSAPMVRNFCIVYIEMATDRASKEVLLLCSYLFNSSST